MPFPILAPFCDIHSVFISQFVFHKIIYSILKVLSYSPYYVFLIMLCIIIHPNSFFFWVNNYLYLAVWY